MGWLHRFASILIALSIAAGCVADKSAQFEDSQTVQTASNESCGRADAAGRASLAFFDAMGDMADACADGDALACNPANYVIGALAGIVYAPMGFLIGLSNDTTERYYCAKIRSERMREAEAKDEGTAAEFDIWTNANKGDAEAQYQVGETLSAEEASVNHRAAWYWYCRAAQQGHRKSQYRLGGFYGEGHDPVARDPVQAYLWYELAADQGLPEASKDRAALARTMTRQQVARAEKLAIEWRSDPEACVREPVAPALWS
jgi:TPR repeat protein